MVLGADRLSIRASRFRAAADGRRGPRPNAQAGTAARCRERCAGVPGFRRCVLCLVAAVGGRSAAPAHRLRSGFPGVYPGEARPRGPTLGADVW